MTRQTKEEVGRQHQGMDRPRVRQVPEGSGEQGMEKTGCKIICGAPTTLAVKGLMMMMMVTNDYPLSAAYLDKVSVDSWPILCVLRHSLALHLSVVGCHMTVYDSGHPGHKSHCTRPSSPSQSTDHALKTTAQHRIFQNNISANKQAVGYASLHKLKCSTGDGLIYSKVSFFSSYHMLLFFAKEVLDSTYLPRSRWSPQRFCPADCWRNSGTGPSPSPELQQF